MTDTHLEQKDKVVIRYANHEDFEAVMDIGDVYGGSDYMFAKYHSFLDDSNVEVWVAVLGGRVVGLQMAHHLEGGKHRNYRGGRVHKDFRKMGVLSSFSSHMRKYISSRTHPALCRTSFFNLNPTAALVEHTANTKNAFEFLRRRVIKLPFVASDIGYSTNIHKYEDMVSKVVEMNADELELFLEKRELVEAFIPNKWLVNRFMGYPAEKSSIPYIINEFSSVHITMAFTEPTKADFRPRETQVTSKKDIGNLDMMSCIESFPTLGGSVVFTCEIYSAGDMASLNCHIAHLVKRMKEETPQQGFLFLTFSNGVITDKDVLPVLKQYGVQDVKQDSEDYVVWFESPVTDETHSKL